jgi:hypothetical protein
MSAIYRREGLLCNPSKSRSENGEIVGSSRFPVVSDYELWNTIENGDFNGGERLASVDAANLRAVRECADALWEHKHERSDSGPDRLFQ